MEVVGVGRTATLVGEGEGRGGVVELEACKATLSGWGCWIAAEEAVVESSCAE